MKVLLAIFFSLFFLSNQALNSTKIFFQFTPPLTDSLKKSTIFLEILNKNGKKKLILDTLINNFFKRKKYKLIDGSQVDFLSKKEYQKSIAPYTDKNGWVTDQAGMNKSMENFEPFTRKVSIHVFYNEVSIDSLNIECEDFLMFKKNKAYKQKKFVNTENNNGQSFLLNVLDSCESSRDFLMWNY